jgi:hypothetical protein
MEGRETLTGVPGRSPGCPPRPYHVQSLPNPFLHRSYHTFGQFDAEMRAENDGIEGGWIGNEHVKKSGLPGGLTRT